MYDLDNVAEAVALYGGKSSRTLTWKCRVGHSWEARVADVNKGQGCPYCSNKRVLAGYNDLSTTHPHLTAEWHPTRNSLTPEEVTAGSRKKVWWKAKCGHEWEQPIKARKAGRGCSVCAGKVVTPGVNDLSTTDPVLAEEWSDKNSPLTPQQVSRGSTKPVIWECSLGHEWKLSPNQRTRRTRSRYSLCPYCSNQKTLVGFNDIATTHPELAKQWHPTKNLDLLPQQITAGSAQKVWWRCAKDPTHEWATSPSERTLRGAGCPFESNVSKQEEVIANLLREAGVHVETRVRGVTKPYELDIYLPHQKIAIEYHGLYWHTEKRRGTSLHYDKWNACEQAGIQLIQIWEDDWLLNKELVQQMILTKVGVSSMPTVFARKTQIMPVTKTIADDLLDKHHIQGAIDGSIREGLYDPSSDSVVAVMVLKKEKAGTYLLARYVTSRPVVGGFTKLLKHVIQEYPNIKEIITFSDHMVSDGSLYAKSGFILDRELPPDYYYVENNVRKHKFNFRLKRFKEDANLIYREGCSEKNLADLNGIDRIWDAGKTRWRLPITR